MAETSNWYDHAVRDGFPLTAFIEPGDDEVNVAIPFKDPTGSDPDEWPEDLRVREVPE